MLEELREEISVFNTCDLLAKVAALNLLPENADRKTSLDALSHLLASLPLNPNAPKISRPRLGKLLRKHLGKDSEPGMADDPFPEMFTEEISFISGPFIVFPSTLAGSCDILTWLLKAAVLKLPRCEFKPFQDDVTRSAILCLSASNAIAHHVVLSRGISPRTGKTADIIVPDASSLEGLANTVTFSRSELALDSVGEECFGETMDPLAIEIGDVNWDKYSFDHGELHHKPFVRIGNNYIVSDPSSLMDALIHRMFISAHEHGALVELTDAYRRVIWTEIEELLQFSGAYQSSISLPPFKSSNFLEGVFTLDADKVLYVQLATDNRADFVGQGEPSSWDVSLLQEDLGRRIEQIVNHIAETTHSADRILTLTVLESTGRQLLCSLAAPTCGNLQLMMTGTSFKAMSLADGRNPLWLWKFAQARARIHDKTEFLAFDILDEYAIYRSRQTYYLSDEALPDLIHIVPGEGLSVRQSNSERLDPHAVPAYESGYLMQVWSAFSQSIPISFPSMGYGSQPALVIEGSLPFPVWVTSQEQNEHRLRFIQVSLVDMAAYWIWQFESIIAPSLAELGHICTMFRIDLVLESPLLWMETLEGPGSMEVTPSSVILEFEGANDGVQVHLHPSFLKLNYGANNDGERQFVRELLLGLGEFLRERYSVRADSLSTSKVDEALEEVAPLGQKKKLINLASDPILYEAQSELPTVRTVQEADIQAILDYMGEHISAKFPNKGTLISKSDRNAVVKEAVHCLYGEIKQLVASFNSRELLSLLLAYNESNILERAQLELTYPTRLACYGRDEEMVDSISREMHANDIASLANRFLVEYTSAQQPSGSRPLSLEAYDRLLALASEICNLGMHSEFTYFDLIDMNLSILPSGRLGFDQAEYESARKSFMSKLSSTRVATAQRTFASHWSPNAEEERYSSHPSRISASFDEAFAREIGLSLTDLVSLFSDIYNLGAKQEVAVKKLSKQELSLSLCQTLGWTEEKVAFALDMICLGPREDFLKPFGTGSQEVYPWRFNRAWSLLRRPLVALGYEPKSTILWGNRHLISAIQYLTDLCSSGRLRATTDPLKRIIGALRQQQSAEFEDLVGDIVTGITGKSAKVRLRKVGHKKITKQGKDLGDIDVLGIVQSARIVLCIECKALAFARTPYEVRNQLKDLFEGTENKASTVQKHLRRVQWVKDNIDLVLEKGFELKRKGAWSVKPALVSDTALYASYLRDNPFPMWSVEDLKNMTVQDIVSCSKM